MALLLLAFLPAHSPRDMAYAMQPDAQRSRAGCVSIGGDVTGKWCDMTCSDSPDDPGCSIYCQCPTLEEKAAAEAERAEVKKAAGGCKPKVDNVSPEWCDGSCAEDPDSDTCEPMCDCPCIHAPWAICLQWSRENNLKEGVPMAVPEQG